MNYGPLTTAIEKLVDIVVNRPATKDADERAIYTNKRNKAWEAIQLAQDDFYRAIKTDRFICEEIDEELKVQ